MPVGITFLKERYNVLRTRVGGKVIIGHLETHGKISDGSSDQVAGKTGILEDFRESL